MSASTLEGSALDLAVGEALEIWKTAHELYPTMTLDPTFKGVEICGERCMLVPNNPFRQDPQWWAPSTDWVQGGLLIERHKIDLSACDDDTWNAWCPDSVMFQCEESGPTPLIAAMRALVRAKSSK